MTSTEFKITPFENPSGKTVFRVSGWLKGQRIRENHATESEALTAKQNYEREVLNLEPLPAITTKLTSEQVSEAEFCFRRLAGANVKTSLTDLLESALRSHVPVEKQLTIEAAYPLFIADKNKQKEGGLSEETLTKYDTRLKLLRDKFGKCFIHEPTAEQLETLVDREGSGAWNRKTDHACLKSFFNWALFRKHRKDNPMKQVPCMEIESDEPVVLTLEQAKKVMEVAQTFQNGSMVPYLTLVLFCGLRVKEVAKLARLPDGGWHTIDLVEKVITIGSQIAKTRSRRLVKIPDNAIQWLRPHYFKTGIGAKRYRLNKIRKLAGLPEEWVQDTYRHTAISFKLADLLQAPDNKSEAWGESVTADWAGNSPTIIHKHYRGLIKAAEVKQFWNIRPAKPTKPGGKIVKLTKKLATPSQVLEGAPTEKAA